MIIFFWSQVNLEIFTPLRIWQLEGVATPCILNNLWIFIYFSRLFFQISECGTKNRVQGFIEENDPYVTRYDDVEEEDKIYQPVFDENTDIEQ